MGLQFLFESYETHFFLRDSGREFQTVGPMQRKIFFERSQESSEELSASYKDRMNKEGSKIIMQVYCSDRYT